MMNYNNILNRSVTEIKPSGIRKFFDIAEQMEDVISLGVGEPDFPTPWHIRSEGIRSLEKGKTRYSSNHGLLILRDEISKFYDRKYGIKYDPEREILVTVGGSEAIDGAVRALVAPGDEVIIPQPSYVCYEPITVLAGGIPVIIETKAENEFRITPEELKAAITPKSKLLILPYPCNPTGAIMRKSDLEAIADVLRGTEIVVISDEIYSELTFGGEAHTAFASIDGMKERTVTVNGFSKAYSMTGWRMGYACGPAAIEALKNGDEDIAAMVEEYDMRRRIIVDGFNSIGLTCREPLGAFYAFPSIASTGMSSEEFCEKLLYAKKIAIVPGTAFGRGGEGFVRASYCYSVDHIKTAIERIGEFVKEIKK